MLGSSASLLAADLSNSFHAKPGTPGCLSDSFFNLNFMMKSFSGQVEAWQAPLTSLHATFDKVPRRFWQGRAVEAHTKQHKLRQVSHVATAALLRCQCLQLLTQLLPGGGCAQGVRWGLLSGFWYGQHISEVVGCADGACRWVSCGQ